MSVNLANWIAEHKIDEVECIVPDINGVQRGKVLPAKKFLSSVRDKSLRIPGSVFICTIDGHYPEDIEDIWDKDPDKILIADPDTICVAPGFKSPTAFVIADVLHGDGTEVEIAPRTILKKVLNLYADRGWKPIMAPEVEFYLVSQNVDPDFPLVPPTGSSGRAETASPRRGRGSGPVVIRGRRDADDVIGAAFQRRAVHEGRVAGDRFRAAVHGLERACRQVVANRGAGLRFTARALAHGQGDVGQGAAGRVEHRHDRGRPEPGRQ